jgi:hypothetical protein
MSESKSSNNLGWAYLGAIAIGLIFGFGPFKNLHCTRDSETKTEVNKSNQPSFTGSSSYTHYKCGGSNGGCLCTKYEKKSPNNSDCVNCDHHKGEHYEFK